MLKRILHTFSLLFALLFWVANVANAQTASAYFGLGTATNSSSGRGIDTFGNGTIFNTPKMGGLFGTIGADFMFRPHLGIGAETSFRFAQGDYAGLKYRPTFYDFNAIWQPVSGRSPIVPEFQAGLGGANLKFYYSQQFCNIFAGCSTSNVYLESSNHFQFHFSGGVRLYVRERVFIRPQIDVRWVNNFFQFGRSWTPQYSIVIGYTFGR